MSYKNNVILKLIVIMACGCKNKQNATAKTQTVRPSNPTNNGSVGGRRIEKRIIR